MNTEYPTVVNVAIVGVAVDVTVIENVCVTALRPSVAVTSNEYVLTNGVHPGAGKNVGTTALPDSRPRADRTMPGGSDPAVTVKSTAAPSGSDASSCAPLRMLCGSA